jgi:hypothetical protein
MGIVEVVKASDDVGFVIVKKTGFDAPPPGAGLATATEAVVAEARSGPGTSACS